MTTQDFPDWYERPAHTRPEEEPCAECGTTEDVSWRWVTDAREPGPAVEVPLCGAMPCAASWRFCDDPSGS